MGPLSQSWQWRRRKEVCVPVCPRSCVCVCMCVCVHARARACVCVHVWECLCTLLQAASKLVYDKLSTVSCLTPVKPQGAMYMLVRLLIWE